MYEDGSSGALAPPSTLNDLDDEGILRSFDLDTTYGPCIGVTRRERWNRARSLGLSPPARVLRVLDRRQELGVCADNPCFSQARHLPAPS